MIPVFIVCGKSPLESFGGGYEVYAYNLAKVLKKLPVKVYMVAWEDSRITALPWLPIYSYIFAKRIHKICQKNNFHKVILWGIGPWGLTGTILKKRLGKKIIFINNYFTTIKHEWKRGLEALRIKDYGLLLKLKYLFIYYTVVQFLAFLEGKVLQAADVIVTNYRSTEQILQQEFNIPASKFYRSHFWIKPVKRGTKETISQKLPKQYIVCLSRQDPRKGINFLLHAMVLLIKKGYKVPLIIVGTGEMLEANKRLAKKLNLSKWVKFLGFVNDLKPLMRKADIFCLPSLEEGAGALVINEAMSYDLPIITTSIDGIVEDIKQDQTGLLVPSADPQALADAIVKLLDNPKLAKKLGANAKISFRQNFSFKKMYQDTKKLTKRYGL